MVEVRQITIEEVISTQGFITLKPAWQHIISLSPQFTPFQTWEWLYSWWKHLGRGELWVLVAKEEDGIVGIMPLVITAGKTTGLRTVQWMSSLLSDYQDIIALPDKTEECISAFANHLYEHRSKWDICDLENIREGSSLLQIKTLPLGGRVFTFEQGISPVITLDATFEQYLKSFSHNKRHRILQTRKKIEKKFDVEIGLVNDALSERMEQLFELHKKQWQRRKMPGKFSEQKIQGFHQEVAQYFLEQDWLRLFYLKVNGQIMTMYYCFQMGSAVYYYLSGYDPSISQYSPGTIMIAHIIQDSIKEGMSTFDFLRGREPYKYFWNANDRKTFRLVLGHGSVYSYLAEWILHYKLLRVKLKERFASAGKEEGGS